MAESPGEFQWRETYFLLFPSDRRPTLTQVDTALSRTDERCQLKNREADDAGYFESVLVVAPDNQAALEISYETGDAVTEQSLELAKQLKDELDTDRLKILMQADARLDIMHFERVESSADNEWGESDDDFPELLDPTCLLLSVEALAELTGGVPVDPASGSVLD